MNARKIVALFVLRGRPGLGHVIPGLALAKAAYDQGIEVHIATYSNGFHFLSSQGSIDIEYKLYNLDVQKKYLDWPGLCPYDHGVRIILPLIEEINADLCFFGGEYLMGPLTSGTQCKSVALFNPEIMINTEKNKTPSTYLLNLLESNDFLLPLDALPQGRPLINSTNIASKVMGCGYYTLPTCNTDNLNETVVVANGGGIEFPENTASYSSKVADPYNWVSETYTYTRDSIKHALECFNGNSTVKVFSCLGSDLNNTLQQLAEPERLEVKPVSLEYYRYLHTASLVISRAGVGFISDVKNIRGGKVVWALSGHDEQSLIASNFEESCADAYFSKSTSDLKRCIESASRPRAIDSDTNPNTGYQNAMKSLSCILNRV
ncbi:hypothetical protein [Saccharospirillum salsuginis]|uniref:Glycosyl transferase family 28 C-terminal domain-containing protein n=1 Tax=Saccharospirillum salsuginis TaxID=418750 RepID=A0A918KBK6_9GAMM|nr:hypothetical protein [Saccharospirillum salsuginis]GGX57620.1 hypothetical protein GCM10007392_26520 [Saccharospirillum salsuginis]